MKSSVAPTNQNGSTTPPESTLAATAEAFPSPGPPSKPDHSGRVIGDFRLLRRLGEGGMGQVYLAEQFSLQRRVAVKLLRADIADNVTSLKRFESEAKAIAQLTHPNIVQVYAVGEDQGLKYMALEYVEGMNLKDYLNKKGPPELPIALAIMRQIASALTRASELGIMHRDIKPENILITRKVEVKVADFGLSRFVGEDLNLTQTGTTMGTPLYMSPEQVMGKPLDPRTDIYSLGATCYHLLAGHPPFLAESAMAVGVRHIADPPTPLAEIRPDLPADLCRLVMRLLAKKPEDRPQTAREVFREIRGIQESLAGSSKNTPVPSTAQADQEDDLDIGATPTASAPLIGTRIDQPKKRRRLWPLAAASVAAAILGGSALGFLLRGDASGHVASSATKATDLTRVKPSAAATSPTKPSLKRPNANALFLEKEKKLKQIIDDTKVIRDPQKAFEFPFDKVQAGIKARAELLSLYVMDLDDESYPKARKFAENETKSPLELYRAIGYIGLAAILATDKNAKESYEALEHAFETKLTPPRKRLGLSQLLKIKEISDLIALTLKLNEERMDPPATVKEIREEMERLKRGEAPGKLRPGNP